MRTVSASGTKTGSSSARGEDHRDGLSPCLRPQSIPPGTRTSGCVALGRAVGAYPNPCVHGAGRSSPSVREPAPSQRQRRPIACEPPLLGSSTISPRKPPQFRVGGAGRSRLARWMRAAPRFDSPRSDRGAAYSAYTTALFVSLSCSAARGPLEQVAGAGPCLRYLRGIEGSAWGIRA